MKRPTKMILFLAVAAITFGSLSHFIGRAHCGSGFRTHNGYERPWQDSRPPSEAPTQRS